MNNKILFRNLRLEDNLEQVSSLIYDTDPYIFPYMFGNNSNIAKKVFPYMIKSNTIYNYKNIKIALLDDKIVGIIISLEAPFTVDHKDMIDSYIKSNVIVDEKFTKVYNEYFKLLEDEPKGIYISNVCVDKLYRHQGIGKQMLDQFLTDDVDYCLESVIANKSAHDLYVSEGFNVEYEYPGFTGIPCYKMVRSKK